MVTAGARRGDPVGERAWTAEPSTAPRGLRGGALRRARIFRSHDALLPHFHGLPAVKPPAPLVPPSFAAGARRALAETPSGVDPWFLRYCGDLAFDAGLRTYARAKWQLLSLAGGVRDKVVVDAGSGFGMCANLLALWGARAVYAVEVHAPMAASHARI